MTCTQEAQSLAITSIIAAVTEQQTQTTVALWWLLHGNQTKYRPTGVGIAGRDYGRGMIWAHSMLNGDRTRIPSMTRLSVAQFRYLLRWMEQKHGFGGRCSTGLGGKEKLLCFLYIVSQPSSYANCREVFQRSKKSIHTAFHQVLRILALSLYKLLVVPQDDRVHRKIALDTKFRHFRRCRGAIDGTQIPIAIPTQYQSPWRNRKGGITQNVLAACDFDHNFRYALAGWKGSSHDGRVLEHAINAHGFSVPGEQTYYLGDHGYGAANGILLIPYSRTRYHLAHWRRASNAPVTHQELFNLRHSSLRTVIERAFGVWKMRFPILMTPRRGFSVGTQILIVYATMALHNYLNQKRSPEQVEMEIAAAEEAYIEQHSRHNVNNVVVEVEANNEQHNARRDRISMALWEDY